MKNLTSLLLVILLLGFCAVPSRASDKVDEDLTKKLSNILAECQKIKPGMTRADLLKIFTTEGGWPPDADHQTFVYRGCQYIKVDVVFTLSEPKTPKAMPTDIISKISTPFLQHPIYY